MKKLVKTKLALVTLFFATSAFAAEGLVDVIEKSDVAQKVQKLKPDLDYQMLLVQQKAVLNDLMQKASVKLQDKNVVEWAQEEVKKAAESVAHNVGKPENPAPKNEYGGYAKDAWLTPEQEKEFYASAEFQETKSRNEKVMKSFFEDLSALYTKVDELSKKGDTLTLEDVSAVKIPVLPELSDKDRSFMMLQDIVVWDGLNKGYVDTYVRPQLDKLKVLAQLNVEYKKFEELSKQAEAASETMIKEFEAKAAEIDKETEKMSEHFRKGENGELIFDPKINIKMPEIKDFMANCYLLDDVGQKLKVEAEKVKEEPKIEVTKAQR